MNLEQQQQWDAWARAHITNYLATIGLKSGAAVHATPFKSSAEIQTTFTEIAKESPDALLVINDATIIDMREAIASLARSSAPVGHSGLITKLRQTWRTTLPAPFIRYTPAGIAVPLS